MSILAEQWGRPRLFKYGPNWFCIGGKLDKGTCGTSPMAAYKKWAILMLALCKD